MAQGITFELRGVPGLKQAFADASKELRAKVTGAVTVSTHNVELRAQQNARQNRKYSQGDLASAIGSRVSGIIGRVGIEDITVSQRGGAISHQNPSIYGRMVENGFRLEMGSVARQITARPFMIPALQAEDDAHYNRIRAAVGSAVA